MAPRAPRDLCDLGRVQVANATSVEFTQAHERDMIHVQVQSHADGVGRDDEIDLAGFV